MSCRNKYFKPFGGVVLAVLLPVQIGWADAPRPQLSVRKLAPGTDAAPFLRAQPPTVERFNFSKLGQPAGQRASVRLAYDDTNLYAAFVCQDSGKGKKGDVTPEGEVVPEADSASMLLDLNKDGRTFVMFTAAASGKKSAEAGRQIIRQSTNLVWDAHVTKIGSTWHAFMTIPFRSLGVAAPTPGTRWGAQLSRSDPATKRPTFWARARKDPREVQHAGDLVFAGADQVSATLSEVNVVVPGPQQATVHVFNPSREPARLKAQIFNDGVLLETQAINARPGDSSVPLRFDYLHDGWHALTIAVLEDSGRLIARSPGIPVRLASFASRVAEYTKVASSQPASSVAAAAEKRQVLSKLTALALRVEAARGDVVRWKALGSDVDAVEKTVGRLQSVCADTAGHGYSVGTETALRKIMRDKRFEGEFGRPARLELARNEFESTQIAILAHDRALEQVRVFVSDLRAPGGVISSQRVALNLVEFVQTGEPPYEIEYTGWFPDPLMDYRPFDLAQGSIRPAWITVRAPEDVPAGLYRGTITVAPANAAATEIPFEVRVRDFSLPTTPHFKTAFAFFEAQYRGWYGSGMTAEQRRQAYQLLLDHRLNPTDIYSKQPRPNPEDLAFCVANGLNAFNLAYVSSAKSKSARVEVGKRLRQQEELLKRQGWWDKAFVYGFDEVWSSRYPEVQSGFGWIKEEFPGLRTMCTVLPNPRLKGYVDIWVPLIANFDHEEAQSYIQDGDQVWWYVCCGPERPWPNFFVDYPATDPRVIFWMNWKYQVPGFLYWTVNRWHLNLKERPPAIQKQIDAGKRWPEVPWRTQTTASFNGDGHLVYPGPDGRLLSSIRLESIRDGIDDYEYFYLLDTLVKQAEKNPAADKTTLAKAKTILEVNPSVVTSRTVFTTDPEVLLVARRELAETIESLNRAMNVRD